KGAFKTCWPQRARGQRRGSGVQTLIVPEFTISIPDRFQIAWGRGFRKAEHLHHVPAFTSPACTVPVARNSAAIPVRSSFFSAPLGWARNHGVPTWVRFVPWCT